MTTPEVSGKLFVYKPTADRIDMHLVGEVSDVTLEVAGDATVTTSPAITLHQQTLDVDFPIASVSPSVLSATDGMLRHSNSEIQTYKRCRRKWWLTYYRMLTPRKPAEVTGTRAIGNRVHRALQRYYVPAGETPTDPMDALEEIIVSDWQLITDSHEAVGGVSRELIDLYTKQCDLERAMIEGYVQWLAETGVDANYEVIAPEAYLEAQLDESLNALIIGRLDVRVLDREQRMQLFLDHKTVGSFQDAQLTLSLDEQMLTYILLEQLQEDRDSTSLPTIGAVYNMLRRVKRAKTAKPPFYQRTRVLHNVHAISSFKTRLTTTVREIHRVRQLLDTSIKRNAAVVYPSPTRDCSWSCPFFQVCGMFDDGSRVEAALEALYVQHDPYGYYVTQQPEPHDTQL